MEAQHFKGQWSVGISIFQSLLKWHQSVCEEAHDTEFCEQSTSNAENNSTEKLSVFLKKGYFDMVSGVNSIIPEKKPFNEILTATDKTRNKLISQYQVIVEKVFGRLCTVGTFSQKCKWDKSKYNLFFKLKLH